MAEEVPVWLSETFKAKSKRKRGKGLHQLYSHIFIWISFPTNIQNVTRTVQARVGKFMDVVSKRENGERKMAQSIGLLGMARNPGKPSHASHELNIWDESTKKQWMERLGMRRSLCLGIVRTRIYALIDHIKFYVQQYKRLNDILKKCYSQGAPSEVEQQRRFLWHE